MIQQTRQMVQKGQIRLEDLPAWVDRRQRNGAPIIVDLTTPSDGFGYDRRADQLDRALAAQGQHVNNERMSRCRDSLTQEVIVKSEGGPAPS